MEKGVPLMRGHPLFISMGPPTIAERWFGYFRRLHRSEWARAAHAPAQAPIHLCGGGGEKRLVVAGPWEIWGPPATTLPAPFSI